MTFLKRRSTTPFAGTIPLLLQLPLIFGLIDVVYRPLKHILHFSPDVINAFIAKTQEITMLTELGSSPELVVIKNVLNPANHEAYMSLSNGALSGVDVGGLINKMHSAGHELFGV